MPLIVKYRRRDVFTGTPEKPNRSVRQKEKDRAKAKRARKNRRRR